MVMVDFFNFLYCSNTVICLAQTVTEFMRESVIERLIWQLWTYVLSRSDVNFIVDYLMAA